MYIIHRLGCFSIRFSNKSHITFFPKALSANPHPPIKCNYFLTPLMQMFHWESKWLKCTLDITDLHNLMQINARSNLIFKFSVFTLWKIRCTKTAVSSSIPNVSLHSLTWFNSIKALLSVQCVNNSWALLLHMEVLHRIHTPPDTHSTTFTPLTQIYVVWSTGDKEVQSTSW